MFEQAHDLQESAVSLNVNALQKESDDLKDAVATALGVSYTSRALVEALSQNARIAHLYSQDSRIVENYTIKEHTEMVLNQYDRYLAAVRLPAGISRDEMRVILALHDIGKPLPANKDDQHQSTIAVIESIRHELPLSDRAWEIGKVLIHNDWIGAAIRGATAKLATIEQRRAIWPKGADGSLTFAELEDFIAQVQVDSMTPENARFARWDATLQKGAATIREEALHLGMDIGELFDLMVLFYQADTSAYTCDAGDYKGRRASPGLDFLYAIEGSDITPGRPHLAKDPESGLLVFRPLVAEAVEALRAKVEA